jgi:hypothetical protein
MTMTTWDGIEEFLDPAQDEKWGLAAMGYRGFPCPAEQVEVLFPDGRWMRAAVRRSWNEVEIPSGKRSRSVDVVGFDDIGFFNGRFDSAHTRGLTQ